MVLCLALFNEMSFKTGVFQEKRLKNYMEEAVRKTHLQVQRKEVWERKYLPFREDKAILRREAGLC